MLNDKMIDKAVEKTLNELDNEAYSTTYDNTIFNFIDYMVEVIMAGQGVDFLTAFDYIKSDEMKENFEYYMEQYFMKVYKPKYSPNDLVIIPREQLDELIKAAGH